MTLTKTENKNSAFFLSFYRALIRKMPNIHANPVYVKQRQTQREDSLIHENIDLYNLPNGSQVLAVR